MKPNPQQAIRPTFGRVSHQDALQSKAGALVPPIDWVLPWSILSKTAKSIPVSLRKICPSGGSDLGLKGLVRHEVPS